MNKVVLIGRLTKDIELRQTTGGISTAAFTLAVDRNFKNKNGDTEADFIQIVTWKKLAEHCAKYLGKGRLIAVSGRVQTRIYDSGNGRRHMTEVVADEVQFLDKAKQNDDFFPIGPDPDMPF